MLIQVLQFLIIVSSNRKIIVLGYKKYYLEDSSNFSSILLGVNKYSMISLGYSRQKHQLKEGNNSLTLSTSGNSGIVVSIHSLNFNKDCNLGESVKFESKGKTFSICGRDHDPYISSSGMVFRDENVTVSYNNKDNVSIYFDFTVTAVTHAPCDKGNYFRCSNSICIWKDLVCDHRNNCGDNSDEVFSLCHSNTVGGFLPLAIGIPLLVILLLFLLCCCFVHPVVPARYGQDEVVYIYNHGYGMTSSDGRQVVMMPPPQPPPHAQRTDEESDRGSGSQKSHGESEPPTSGQSSEKDKTDAKQHSKEQAAHSSANEDKISKDNAGQNDGKSTYKENEHSNRAINSDEKTSTYSSKANTNEPSASNKNEIVNDNKEDNSTERKSEPSSTKNIKTIH